jgi:predicted DCC family thiol-disulfide oxidoreductase YuxK
MPENSNNKAIILFDGVCNFCNSSINFVIRHDKKNYFLFATFQSEKGRELLKKLNVDNTQTDSVVLIENSKVYIKSTAALRISKHLNRLYPLFYGCIIIPPFIRNAVYDYVARNRYKWFGKKEICMVPTNEIKEKFIS